MHHYLFTFLFFVLTTFATAQTEGPFLYKQDEIFGFRVNSNKNLLLAFYPLEGVTPEVVTVRWEIQGKSITLSTPLLDKGTAANFITATFTFPLLDANLEGHLEWAKAVLEQLDDAASDSLVVVNASIDLSKDSTVTSTIPISFIGSWNKNDEFWNRAAHYKLLKQQVWINDSIKFYKQEGLRTEALINLNQKVAITTQTQMEQTQNDLWKSCQDTTLVDSLLTVETALSAGLEKAKNGAAMTNTEKMRLADQTTLRSQLLQQINAQKNTSCQTLLQTLLQKRQALANIQRQQKLLDQQHLLQQKKQNSFRKLKKKTSQQLAVIVTRLPK